MLILKGHKAAFLKFRERYPNVRIFVLERNWTNLLEYVSEGTVDFAFGSAPETRGNFSFEEWTETDYLLLCPEGHAVLKEKEIALESIADHPLILLERGTADRQHVEHTFEKEGLSIDVVFETSSYSLINEAVLNRAGIAVVNALWPRPESATRCETANTSHLFGKKRIGLFRRNDVYLPPYTGDYLVMLRETLMA